MQTAGMIAAFLLASSLARGQEAPFGSPDIVVLREGGPDGRLLGKVMDVAAGDHVTITLPTGETRTVPWTAITRVLIAKPPPPLRGPKVRVHVAARRRVELQRRPMDSVEWQDACASPCDMELPLADSYRVLGMGESKEFRLRGKAGDVVELDIKLPSTGGKISGGILAGVGGFVLTFSSLFVLAGATSPSSCQGAGDIGPCGAQATSLLDSGLVGAAIGAAAGVLGLVLLHYSATTDVLQNGDDVLPMPEKRPDFSEPRVRIASEPIPSNGPALVIPFLSGTF